MKKIIVKIDGIAINASHFVPMGEEKAVTELAADKGIIKKIGADKVADWAPKAWEILDREFKKATDAAKAKVVEDAKKKVKGNEFTTSE